MSKIKILSARARFENVKKHCDERVQIENIMRCLLTEARWSEQKKLMLAQIGFSIWRACHIVKDNWRLRTNEGTKTKPRPLCLLLRR